MQSYSKRAWWSKYRLSERLKTETFLEAAVNAAFVIAAADGSASAQEYDALLDRLELLAGIDRDVIDEQFTTVSNELEASGFEPRIARVGELVTDPDSARAVLMLAMAIALADNEVSTEEREIAKQLADGIGLGAVDLDSLVTEIRG
jgi:tellurite resistance protein